MTPDPTILVLLHEHDRYPTRRVHMIWPLVDQWRAQGIDVQVARGPRDPLLRRPFDLVFPHLNLTRTPDEYREVLDRLPNVVNAGVYDISKRAISSNLVGPDDDWDGPVIVKTDKNYGGLPESSLERTARTRSLRGRLDRWVKRRVGFGAGGTAPSPHNVDSDSPENGASEHQPDLESAETLLTHQYRVLGGIDVVPPGVFRNPHMVVERFLPEMDGDLFCVRWYSFLGDREWFARGLSPEPVVKGPATVRWEPTEPSPEIRAIRQDLGWDYGKFDFVLHGGRVVLLDANKTPGKGPPDVNRTFTDLLGPGIESLLARCARGRTEK
jgi:hypothetical protein